MAIEVIAIAGEDTQAIGLEDFEHGLERLAVGPIRDWGELLEVAPDTVSA